MRGLIAGAFAVCVATACVAAESDDAQSLSGGYFSSAATFLVHVFTNHRTITIPSPDGTSRVVVRPNGEKAVAELEGRIGSTKLKLSAGPNADLLWSPDSEAFFVTEDDGGVMGPYALTVVGRMNGRLV